jgi:glyoxylase-like metal-dependent hydrolase (beta-lactamase superfamily II)
VDRNPEKWFAAINPGFLLIIKNSKPKFLRQNCVQKISRGPTQGKVFSRLKIFVGLLLTAAIFSGCSPLQKLSDPFEKESKIPEKGKEVSKDRAFIPDGYFEPLPDLGEKGYLLQPLAPDVYFFSTGTYNTMFITTSMGVVVIDPIRGKGHLLKKAIQEVTDKSPKYMIYSHAHLDHIGDAHLFAKDVQIIAHLETRKLLERYKDPHRPIPQISFGKNYSLSLGGTRIDLIYPGEGHGKGNIMIHLPRQKVLMVVDVATPKSVPFLNFATIDIYSQIKGIEQALNLDFDVYVAGHLHRTGTKKEMLEVLKYYLASKRANKAALRKISFLDVKARSRTQDPERLFGEYYQAVAGECYRILKKEWKPRLMGFEAFTRGHCDVWTGFHRTQVAPEPATREEK